MVKFYAVVVMYNSVITQSRSCINIQKINNHDITMIIVDNSTIENDNKSLSSERNWMYISMNGNTGLSKAYNKVLDSISDNDGVIIWLDDDTDVTQEYFDKLEQEVNNRPECSIFAPMIQGQDGKFWSPNEARFLKNKQIKDRTQSINENKFNAINSCTAVRLEVYKDYRYDERLFLDQVDHNFFEDQRNLHRKFCKLDVIIHHNFSTRSKMKNIDAVKTRYSIMIPDFLRYCSKSKSRYALGWVKVAGWGVREGIKYKNPGFFFWCIKQIFIFKK